IGSTLGAGVYVVVGGVARHDAGPSVIVSFLIAALSSILSGLCYAEFGARVPKTGSAYIYSYVTVGELMAFITGWNLILQYIIGTSSVARAWSSNFDDLINKKISNFFSQYMSMNVPGFAAYVDLFSFGITSIVTAILVFGARESSMFNNVFTLINLGVISYVTITGLFRVNIANWRINPDNVPLNQVNRSQVGDGGFFPFGFSGVLRGAGTCFYSFVGFDIIATTGEEVRNPQRAIPIAIIVCLSVCFVAYASVSAVLTLMVPYYAIPPNAPLPYAFEQVGWSVARYVIAIGAVCALTTSLLGSIFPLPRILYAMSSDGLLFRFFGKISKRFKTPVLGTLISGLLAGVLSAVISLKDLVDMMSIGTLLAYSLVAVSILILRKLKYSVNALAFNRRSILGVSLSRPGDELSITRIVRPTSSLVIGSIKLQSDGGTTRLGRLFTSSGAESTCFQYCSASKEITSPKSLRHYIQLSFVPEQADPTPTSEWVNTMNTYLLFVTIGIVDLALAYFGGDDIVHSGGIFITVCVIVCIFGLLSILLCISLARQPENTSKVSFRTPGVPWVPAVSIFVNLHLMFQMSGTTWIYYSVWMLI
ncbi:high affinity cationic amino acid transporter 1, partial [Clonorchis sinensis]